MQEQPPLFLEFMQALTPHFHWIAERERCGLWMVAKRVDLWLNRVFDTAEDFRLRGALPALLSALRALHPDSWEACLHVNTSPIPRFMGGVEDAILDRGLGLVGTHQLPADLWDAVVPPFYREGLRDFGISGRLWLGSPCERRLSAGVLHFCVQSLEYKMARVTEMAIKIAIATSKHSPTVASSCSGCVTVRYAPPIIANAIRHSAD